MFKKAAKSAFATPTFFGRGHIIETVKFRKISSKKIEQNQNQSHIHCEKTSSLGAFISPLKTVF